MIIGLIKKWRYRITQDICSIADPLEVSIPTFYQELVLVIQLD